MAWNDFWLVLIQAAIALLVFTPLIVLVVRLSAAAISRGLTVGLSQGIKALMVDAEAARLRDQEVKKR